MLRDRVIGLLRHVPVVGPTEDEFDPFAPEETDPPPDDEGDDSVHAGGSQPPGGA